MKKKIMSALVTLTLSLTILTPSSFAEGNLSLDKQQYENKEEVVLAKQLQSADRQLSKLNKDNLQREINNLSDDQYLRFMHNFVLNNDDSIEEMEDKLNAVGIEFSMNEKDNSEFQILSGPSDIELSVYSSKRALDSYWYLTSSWDYASYESKPATLDIVSIEWDPEYGEYYSSSVPSDRITTKKDGSKRLDGGIYLFNVDDGYLSFDSYCSVQVTPKKSGWLNYGSKYTHTYTTSSTSATGEADFRFDSTGPSGGITYSVEKQYNVSDWEKYEDNAVSVH